MHTVVATSAELSEVENDLTSDIYNMEVTIMDAERTRAQLIPVEDQVPWEVVVAPLRRLEDQKLRLAKVLELNPRFYPAMTMLARLSWYNVIILNSEKVLAYGNSTNFGKGYSGSDGKHRILLH